MEKTDPNRDRWWHWLFFGLISPFIYAFALFILCLEIAMHLIERTRKALNARQGG